MSNEITLSTVAAALAQRVKPGGVYLGVGPEQNFHYIAAIRPKIAFINDIRRGNLHMHLMYKALSSSPPIRAEFVSRLFTKPRPAGLTASRPRRSDERHWDLRHQHRGRRQGESAGDCEHLTKTPGFPAVVGGLAGVEYVYHAFYRFVLRSITRRQPPDRQADARRCGLMMAIDQQSGGRWGYLASEDKFSFLKNLHTKN